MKNYRNAPAGTILACIGLISDTHRPRRLPEFPPTLFEALAGVDLLLHAGDVGQLSVLNELSQIAPLIAVHGNDETAEAQRELPYQQLVSVGNHRLLLWHSHFPDRAEEMASRKEEPLQNKMARMAGRGQQAGADIVIFGHWHIPLARQMGELLVVNPGAIASGNPFTRQTEQTVALLWLLADARPVVQHIDLADPGRDYTPDVAWEQNFMVTGNRFQAAIRAPELVARWPHFEQTIAAERLDTVWHKAAHRCWRGQLSQITLADFYWQLQQEGITDVYP